MDFQIQIMSLPTTRQSHVSDHHGYVDKAMLVLIFTMPGISAGAQSYISTGELFYLNEK